jgi:hypothetical protein
MTADPPPGAGSCEPLAAKPATVGEGALAEAWCSASPIGKVSLARSEGFGRVFADASGNSDLAA